VAQELDTATWARVFREAAALGCLQVHLSGGEPTARRDIVEIVRAASQAGLYTNLITSGVLTGETRLQALVEAGLDHVQLSVQDAEPGSADRIGGYRGGHAKKLQFAGMVHESGLPLTLNAVVHRQNLEAATAAVEAARRDLRGRLVIDYVVPDYYAKRPKACMGGWGRQFLAVSPAGRVLPCHAAESLPGFDFPSVRTGSLAEAWQASDAFNRFRGTDWMPAPCSGCDRREIDWGGCRCQAFALTGNAAATDPACGLSPDHALLDLAVQDARAEPPAFIYRRIGGLPVG
jgi:pyrroloquinoline quinone biosynthesis protein E